MANANGLRETPDHGLQTPEAINFRIEKIKRENNNVLTPALMRRVAALKARLPKDPNAPLAPAFAPHLLASKKDVDEYAHASLVIA